MEELWNEYEDGITPEAKLLKAGLRPPTPNPVAR